MDDDPKARQREYERRHYEKHPESRERMKQRQRAWHQAHKRLREVHPAEWHRFYLIELNKEIERDFASRPPDQG